MWRGLAGITVRPMDIRNFLKLRTRYSIIKGDGDFGGDDTSGYVGAYRYEGRGLY